MNKRSVTISTIRTHKFHVHLLQREFERLLTLAQVSPAHGQELRVPRRLLEFGMRQADPVDAEVEAGELVLEADHGEVGCVSSREKKGYLIVFCGNVN